MQKKIRFYYWLFKGFIQKHKWVIIPAAILGGLTFSQVPKVLPLIPQPKPVTYVGRVGRYSLSNLPRDIQVKVSSGLTEISQTGQAQGSLASEWKILDDGKTYVFSLSDQKMWQDGTPVLATELDYTINDVSREVLDDKTIVFRLEEPFAPFPTILSQPIFKRKQVSYLQVVNQTKIIGTGEYQIKKLKFNGNALQSIVLESEKEKLVYRFYNTEEDAILGFRLAEVDRIEEISDPGELANWEHIKINQEIDRQEYAVMYFNVDDANLTAKQIRQALAYTIPKPDDDTRAISPISLNSHVYNPNVKPYEYNLETAKSLLTDFNTDFEIELSTTPVFRELAETIKASWEELGIKVRVNVVNVPDLQNYQALLIGQRIPYDPDQYLLWHSTQESNITNYKSAKIDKLLEDGRKTLDEQDRKNIYIDFQRFLVEDTPAVFLFYLKNYTISR